MVHSGPIFLFFHLLTINYKKSRRPLVLEATTLSTEPQPLLKEKNINAQIFCPKDGSLVFESLRPETTTMQIFCDLN